MVLTDGFSLAQHLIAAPEEVFMIVDGVQLEIQAVSEP